MTIASKLIEKGKIEGKLEGKIEGEKTLLMSLIKSKWGALSPDIKQRLSEIDTSEELEALGEKIIGSDNIEDLFKDE